MFAQRFTLFCLCLTVFSLNCPDKKIVLTFLVLMDVASSENGAHADPFYTFDHDSGS